MSRSANSEKRIHRSFSTAVRWLVLALMVCMPAFLSATGAFALAAEEVQGETGAEQQETGAFEVTDYDFSAVVGKDHSYTVEEKIRVNIPARLQSITFAIPSGKFRIRDVEVDDTSFRVNKASEASSITITDPEQLGEGQHAYTIRYAISEYRDRDSTKDMFYFNVLLPEWRQPIGKVSIVVTFPDDFPFDDMQCYAGQFGVQDVNNKIIFKPDSKAHSVRVTGKHIPENFGITLKAQLTDGYWENAADGSWALIVTEAVMVAASLILLLLWSIGGRDPKVKKRPEARPIEGLTPEELRYVFNSEVRVKDVLYMIIRFAQNGYLRISEYEPKKYRLYKVSQPAGEERMYRNAYRILFEDVYEGRALEMEKIGPRIKQIRDAIEDDVASGFSSGDSSPFTPISRAFRYIGAAVLGMGLCLANAVSYSYNYQSANIAESIVVGVVAAAASLSLCRVIDMRDSFSVSAGVFTEILCSVMFALPIMYASYRIAVNTGRPWAGIPVILASAFAEFLIVIMRARGSENAVLVSRIRRLRNFIYHPTPKELLKNHLEDSSYFYEMMIYALAFGAEEAWAISFLTLDVCEPDWYTDDIEGHAFTNLREEWTTIDYARELRSFVRTFENVQHEARRK